MNLIIFCGDLQSCPWPLVSTVHVMEGKGDTYFLQLGDESEIEENFLVLKELVPIGPIEGAQCHLCGTPRKIIIFTG